MRATTANDNSPARWRAQSIPIVGQVGPDGVVSFFDVAVQLLARPGDLTFHRRDGQLVDLKLIVGHGRDQS